MFNALLMRASCLRWPRIIAPVARKICELDYIPQNFWLQAGLRYRGALENGLAASVPRDPAEAADAAARPLSTVAADQMRRVQRSRWRASEISATWQCLSQTLGRDEHCWRCPLWHLTDVALLANVRFATSSRSCFGEVLFLSERLADIASDWTSETPTEGPVRLVITLVSRLVDGAASVLAAEFFSRFRRDYAADPRISAVIPRSRWRNSTVLPSGSSTKMVPIPKSSGSSAEVMSRRRA
jgi:hypothetical protein